VKRSSSTLLAPTASSLAKSRPSSSDTGSKRTSLTTGTGIYAAEEDIASRSEGEGEENVKGVTSPVLATLEPITNVNTKGESSSRVGGGNGASLKKIFDQPLTTDTFSNPSKIPVPASKTHTRTTSSSSSTTNKEDIAPTNGKPTPTYQCAEEGGQRKESWLRPSQTQDFAFSSDRPFGRETSCGCGCLIVHRRYQTLAHNRQRHRRG
jgi:hypothetical protein